MLRLSSLEDHFRVTEIERAAGELFRDINMAIAEFVKVNEASVSLGG